MNETPQEAMPRWLDAISVEERRELLRINPLRSWAMVVGNWAIVFLAMAVVAAWPNPLTAIVALFVIGSRQLGMAIVMHEAAHRTLFESRRLNDWVGNWLAAYPVFADVGPYRSYHLVHHSKTGTAEDPDIGLAAPFPITRSSFRRKVWRDLSGQTGWKQLKTVLSYILGQTDKRNRYNQDGTQAKANVGWHKLVPVVGTNLVLLAILALAGYAWLYALWAVAWLTTYRLVTRIRSIAEHGMVPDPGDPLRNTRTTRARWWERLLLAPNHVNYHLEHHLLMTVPAYNLKRMHRLLQDRGVLDRACVANGYAEVLRLATARPEATA